MRIHFKTELEPSMFIREVHLYRDTISMVVARINLSRNISPTTTKLGLVPFKDEKTEFLELGWKLLQVWTKKVSTISLKHYHKFKVFKKFF